MINGMKIVQTPERTRYQYDSAFTKMGFEAQDEGIEISLSQVLFGLVTPLPLFTWTILSSPALTIPTSLSHCTPKTLMPSPACVRTNTRRSRYKEIANPIDLPPASESIRSLGSYPILRLAWPFQAPLLDVR
jgi:hypothetical protein